MSECPDEYLHAIQVPGGPRLVVTDLITASRTRRRYDVVISLLDPGTELAWDHPRHHLFHVNDRDAFPGPNVGAGFLAALLGVDLTGAGTVLIHCHGGYSRSPAAAMLWALKLGAGLDTIERGIDWAMASPNRRMLALGEAHLGVGRVLRDLAGRRSGKAPAGAGGAWAGALGPAPKLEHN